MPTLLDYFKGVAAEYGPPLCDAALGELNAVLESADAQLRDPKELRVLVRGVVRGLAESWLQCPHGSVPSECNKCVKTGEKRR